MMTEEELRVSAMNAIVTALEAARQNANAIAGAMYALDDLIEASKEYQANIKKTLN